ncbi:methyltransferase domain-containing protein [Sinomonas sp. ASV322]|uniref:methyltransferase domain-containing protein n=1 Tax=Sinomonas sp. ASV322 TaxID=3041920 RepID=UPI0027DE397B|nr:methyltransferase domain-containing protein [Sinomonas sp. ASV322]MDQ4503067.1 methyltransferase domain-containing protein [Sinomonas sp. ASV322]
MDTTPEPSEAVGPLDTVDLEDRVKAIYEQVADYPFQEFHFETGRSLAERLGYPRDGLDRIPEEAVDSFAGVGYFHDLADLKPGERVLDLGSGSGTDSFLAALAVRPGLVVGIDMTRAQIAKARRLAHDRGNVEFREGHIEEPSVEDGSIDCVISNGVINLVPDKGRVFAVAARALRPGGRLAIADIVTDAEMPETVTCDASLWAACIGGAMQRGLFVETIEEAGFHIETIRPNEAYQFLSRRAQKATAKYGVTSISLLARKA